MQMKGMLFFVREILVKYTGWEQFHRLYKLGNFYMDFLDHILQKLKTQYDYQGKLK